MSTRFRYPDPHTEDTAENRLKHTLFIVEGRDYDLWCNHCVDSLFRPYNPKRGYAPDSDLKWEQVSCGWGVQVGTIGRGKAARPVMVDVQWYYIEGQPVCFYHGCSQVVDHAMIEEWFDTHFTGTYDKGHRRARCDAANFSHCLDAIKEANTPGYVKPAPLMSAAEVDKGFLGVQQTVVACSGKVHTKGDPGCVCHLIGKQVVPTKRYDSPFVGAASYHIKGSRCRVRRSEVGLPDVMN